MADCLHSSNPHELKQSSVQTQGQQEDKRREELADDLADCLAQLESSQDLDKISQILGDFEQFDPDLPEFDVMEHLSDFHQKYENLFPSNAPAAKVQKSKHRKLLSYSARAAIIAIFFLVCISAAQAVGFNILGIFSWWNDAQFRFVHQVDYDPQRNDFLPDSDYTSLQEAIDAYGIHIPLVPTEFPEGTELVSLSVTENENQPMFTAEYTISGEEMFITIRQSTSSPFVDAEKDAQNVEIYTKDGIEHCIVTDVRGQKVIWRNGMWECLISCNIGQDSLIAMIDSIYKKE